MNIDPYDSTPHVPGQRMVYDGYLFGCRCWLLWRRGIFNGHHIHARGKCYSVLETPWLTFVQEVFICGGEF
jgi:hypothetical protein